MQIDLDRQDIVSEPTVRQGWHRIHYVEQAIHAAGALWGTVGEGNLILGWIFEANAAKFGGKWPKTRWSRLL